MRSYWPAVLVPPATGSAISPQAHGARGRAAVLGTSFDSTGAERLSPRGTLAGYLAHKVVEHFGGQYANMELVYAIETTPLGTGGAIRQALRLCKTDHVFVLNGDTYLDLEADEIENRWQDHHNPIIVAREIPDTSRYGRLRTDHATIVGFSDKGHQGPGLINAGCYVLPKPILEETGCGESFSLEADWLPRAVMQRRFDVFVSRGLFIDIGIPRIMREPRRC